MFARFRHTKAKLQVSVVENCRRNGRVQQHYVASLGSLPRCPSPRDRIAFWQHVNARMLALSNRIDEVTQGKLRGEIHARVPVPSIEEERQVELENVAAD